MAMCGKLCLSSLSSAACDVVKIATFCKSRERRLETTQLADPTIRFSSPTIVLAA
jgi:hypothetical protein